ncbi:MAG: amidase [Azospirillum sp.]|nr:amidase [Azospirillum sp.]MCZ8122184.1 amidase [Magnetospirillum sp.]
MSGALRTLRDALARREISARAAVERSLAAIARRDPALCAFLTVAADSARAAADALDARPDLAGPLHGVPVAIKDLADTAGIRTTYGSTLYRDHVPDADDAVVARLKRAGAVIVGKTMTPEFGFGAVCVNDLAGPTRNPFDPALTSGGSSGGAAVAVATGMVPLAHGTDFGGSVRTPASFCGVAALRPTPGRLPNPGRALGWDMLSTAGFIAGGADDLALALEATAGPDPRDPLSTRDFPAEIPAHAPRVAWTEDFGVAAVAEAVRAPFRAAVAKIDAAFGARPAHPDCAMAIETFHTLRPPLIRQAYADHYRTHGDALTRTVRWWIERGAETKAADWLAAEAERTALYRRFLAFFESWDALVAPAAAVLPWPNEAGDVVEIDGVALPTLIDYLAVTFVVSLVGCPVVVLPVGRSAGGLPVGIQLIGAPGKDTALLALAARIEEACGFRRIEPP